MNKRKGEAEQETNLFSNKRLMVVLFIVATIFLGFLVSSFFLQTSKIEFSLKAAIIDQLGEEFQNLEFKESGMVANILKKAGFNVSYHGSKDVNVTFYRQLARSNYGLIILRSHSATRKGESIVDLFTSEEFKEYKYLSDQQNGLLTKGQYFWNREESYFAITPEFIENLDGYFPKSVVIAMGCNSLNETCTEMAEAFIKKGATAYIGWTGLVETSHTDNETVKLLRMLLEKNKTVATAVDYVHPDYHFPPGSKMTYYPKTIGSLRISDLVMKVEQPPNHLAATTLFEPILTDTFIRSRLTSEEYLNLVCVKLAC